MRQAAQLETLEDRALLAVAALGTTSSQLSVSDTLSSYTVNAGSDRLLVVAIGEPGTATPPTAVTFNGMAMTQGTTVSDGSFASDAIWYLPLGDSVSATTGDVVVTHPATGEKLFIAASAYSGVAQTGSIDVGPTFVDPTDTDNGELASIDSSLNVTSATGDLVFDIFDAFNSTAAAAITTGAGQTRIHDQSGALSSGFGHYVVSTEPGAATVTMSWDTSNPTGAESVQHATININQSVPNLPPVGADNTVTATEDGFKTFAASDFGFADVNAAPANSLLAVKITTTPATGTLTDNGSPVSAGDFVPVANITGGLFKFTPVADGNGSPYTTFTFQVQDNGGTSGGGVDLDQSADTITVNVTAVADITNDSLTTNEDSAVTANVITGTNGATADTFANAGAGITSVTQGANGSVSFNANGSVTYTPTADYNGSDSFTYTVTSGGATETATVNVTINAVADITNDSLTVTEDGSVTANLIAGNNGATADAFEDAGAALTSVTQGTHGAVTFNANGSVDYTPDSDYHGSDSFTYTVTSGGVTETATVNVTVNAVVDITNDSLTTNEDSAITANVITGTNGATADTFENVGAALSSVTQGANGSVTFNANGSVTYTPDADFHGSDSFTYTVTSGGATETATVNVTVNAVADITNDSLTTNEDTPITANVITGTNGATADTFENAGKLLTSVTQGTSGAVAFNANGSVTYTPSADYNGSDSFTYTVTTNGTTETATVSVTVNAVADITSDSLTTNEDTPITANVIAGTNGATADTFENGGAAITSVTQGTNGAVTFNANGSVTYTPSADYNGSDSFTYTVTTNGTTETATVNVTVNAVADITNDSLTTNEDIAVTANVITGTNGATADTFENAGAIITSVTQGTNGAVTFNANGSVTYTPTADYNGSDSFTYTVTTNGTTETATVSVTINAVADITNDAISTNEDTAKTANVITGTGGATADTFESGGAALTSVTQGTHGAVTFNANGSVTYTPSADFNGSDSFTYTVRSAGLTETATVNVTINAVADITNDVLFLNGNPSVTANLITGTNGATADTFENAGAAITSVTQGTTGVVTFNANGSVTYTPNVVHGNTDSFTYTVTSGGTTETATVNVTINSVPVISSSATASAPENTPITTVVLDVNATDAEAPPQTLVYSLSGTDALDFTINSSTGEIKFAAVPNAEAPADADMDNIYNVTVTVTDNGSPDLNATQAVTITVTNVIEFVGTTLASLAAGVLTVTDTGKVTNDTLTIALDANGNIVITDRTHAIAVAGGVNPTSDFQGRLPLASVTQIIINAGGGSDMLTVDFTNGNPIPSGGLTYNGGVGPQDTLLLKNLGTPFSSTTYRPTTVNSGSFVFVPKAPAGPPTVMAAIQLTFTHLGGATLSGTEAADLIFDLTSSNDTAALTDLTGAAGVGVERFTGSSLLTLDFSVAGITGLTVNGNGGHDNLKVNSLDAAFAAGITLNGGEGNDIIDAIGSKKSATLGVNTVQNGGNGDDKLTGGIGNDTLNGNAGKDVLKGAAGNDRLFGGTENDNLDGGMGNDTLLGEAGNDTLTGGEGADGLNGGADDDKLDGGNGNDTLVGDDGTESTLTAAGGNDTLLGGAGADLCIGGGGDDSIDGGTAPGTTAGLKDTVAGHQGTDIIKDPVAEIDEAFTFNFNTLLV